MYTKFLTKKNNALTDGNIPDRQVLTNKLVNVLNKLYEDNGVKFEISFPDLIRSLGMTSNSGKNRERVKEAIKILQYPIEVRNFNYKGKGIKWLSVSFLSAYIESGYSDIIKFKLDDMLIEALKQKEQYTIIDLDISNKFRTKYGIVIWEMYLRYKNQNRSEVGGRWTFQTFSLEDLNRKFGTNFKHNSKMLEGVERGLKEVKKITDKDIYVQLQKETNKIGFFWEKEKPTPKHLKSEKDFIAYIREKYMPNPQKDIYPTIHTNDDGEQIKVTNKGLLYGRKDEQTIAYNAKTSQKIWTHFYKMAKEGREF